MTYFNFKNIKEYFEELKEAYPNLSDHQLLDAAIQLQRNDILVAGLQVSQNNDHPSGIEAIAIQLGYEG